MITANRGVSHREPVLALSLATLLLAEMGSERRFASREALDSVFSKEVRGGGEERTAAHRLHQYAESLI
jgi:hypothetical protein